MSSPAKLFLVTGGTGKVGSRVAKHLVTSANIPAADVRVATRNPATANVPYGTATAFNWFDETTWAAALAGGPAIYIISPETMEPLPIVQRLVEAARKEGSRRFVLQSASPVEEGGPGTGALQKYLHELGDQGLIEWASLRPTWFQENMSEQEIRRIDLKENGKFYSAAGDGRIPLVAVDDIAAVAVVALTRKEPLNSDPLVLGPELLSYDEMAAILTEVLGKKIEHVKVTEDELAERWSKVGVPAEYAKILAAMDTGIKHGAEDRQSDTVERLTGRKPRTFREYAIAQKAAWL